VTTARPTKRIETLVREAKADLDAHQYRHLERNGCDALEIARALDKIREGEKVLRRAYV
jgi:hypothetical protein